MQIQEAINLVQSKFQAEAKGETDGDAVEQYQNAFADFPVMMEVATYIFAQGLITQNYQAALRRQQEKQANAQGGAGGPQAPGGAQPGPAGA